MHTSDQPSPSSEENKQEQQPLYEFPADYLSQLDYPDAEPADPTNATNASEVEKASSPPTRSSQAHDAEAIRQGLIYPPPPSFYMQPPTPQGTPEQPAPSLPPAFPDPRYAPETQGYYPTPPFAANAQPGVHPGIPAAPPVAKRSRKWIWIVVAVLSIAVLGSCGLCGWASYTLFAPAVQQATAVTGTITDYYTAIQDRDYSTAYNYISPQDKISNLTAQKFIQEAQSQDEQFGAVQKFTPQSTGIVASSSTNSTDVDTFTMTVQVTRAKETYNVTLTLHKINSQWKITNFDRI